MSLFMKLEELSPSEDCVVNVVTTCEHNDFLL